MPVWRRDAKHVPAGLLCHGVLGDRAAFMSGSVNYIAAGRRKRHRLDVYILRHGKAQAHGHPVGDGARDLTLSGRYEVSQVGDAIKRLVPGLDVVATSPLVRARRTAQIVAKRMGLAKPAVWDELKPESHLGLLYGRLADIDFDSKVMLVGHEPHLTQFVGSVITGGGDGRCGLTLRKPGLARLAVRTAAPDRVEGDLLWLIPPRVLRLL